MFFVSAQDTEVNTITLLDAEKDVSIYGATRQSEKYVKQGEYSFYSSCDSGTYGDYNQWSMRADAEMFNIDLTDYVTDGALIFWVYVDGDVSGVTNTYGVYLMSQAFSWVAAWYGYNVSSQITKSNDWNKIVIPFSAFEIANSSDTNATVDWASIKSISLHAYGGNGINTSEGTAVDLYLDDFIAVSDVEKWQAEEKAINTQELLDVETETNVYGAIRQSEKHVKQGEYSFYSSCNPGTWNDYHQWGIRANEAMFNLDLSDFEEKGAVVFWIYVDGSVSSIPNDIQLWLQANDGGYSWGARNIYEFKSQLTQSHAWNRIVIPFSEFIATEGGINFNKVTSMSVFSSGTLVDMYYDDFIAVSDYEKYLETCSDSGYMILDDAEGKTKKEIYGAQVSVKNTQNGEYSYYTESTDGDGHWIYRSQNVNLCANISAYIDRGAFAFYMYIDGSPSDMGDIICWLTSDASYSDYFASGKCNGYKWSVPNSELVQGWNEIVLPFSEADTAVHTTNVADDVTNPANINQFSVMSTGKHNVDIWTDCYMVIEDSANGMPMLKGNDNSAIVTELPFSCDIALNTSNQLYEEKIFEAIDASSHGLNNLQLVLEADITGTWPAGTTGQLEIASSGTSDVNELHFLLDNISFKTGRNVIRLNLEDGNTTGGKIDLSAINYARIYTNTTFETGFKFNIISLRIEDTSYVKKDLGIIKYGIVGTSNTSFTANGDFHPAEIKDTVLTAEIYITDETMLTRANVTIGQGNSFATASLVDYSWKHGKNVIYIPVSEFEGSSNLVYIDSASITLTAENASADTEVYVSAVQLADATKLGGYGVQGNLTTGNIDVDTAAVEFTLNIADVTTLNEGVQIVLSNGTGSIFHNLNSQLQVFEVGRNTVVLPLGDFVNNQNVDYATLNSVNISDSVVVEDVRIINSCNNVQKAVSYMPTLFSDNMMFQQQKPIAIWGYSAPLSEASATLYQGDNEIEKKTAQADKNGKYEFSFTPLKGGFDPYRIEVVDAFGNEYTINNILIGEVWLAGGQSNMEFTVAKDMDSATLLSDSYLTSDINKGIRVYLEPTTPNAGMEAYQPMGDVTDIPGAVWGLGTDATAVSHMSSLAYTYARELVQELNVPVGILNTAVGGTCIETWISRDYAYDKIAEFDDRFYMAEHIVVTNIYSSGALYHQKIEALEGFGIAGTIWYQGESNSTKSYDYDVLLSLLKSSYSDVFGFENNGMPFIFTQVAPDLYNPDYRSQHTAYLSEAMEDAYRLNIENNMAMLAIYDLPLDHIKNGSSSGAIHPSVKTPVGKRFALSAMNLCYGGTGEDSAPIYVSMEIIDNAIYVTFRNVGKGLKAVSGNTIYGFAIAGENNIYSPGIAEIIDSDTIKVYSHLVTEPKHVTYAFETMNQSANLANSDGIVASPFRTNRYADSVNTVDETVTYYNVQEWMGANGDSWQNISFNQAAVSQLWSVDGKAPEYTTDRYSEGSASLKLNVAENTTVIATPKMNVYGGKNINLADYSVLSVDVSGTSIFEISLVVTKNGTDYTVGNKINVLTSEGFGSIVFDLTTLLSSDGTKMNDYATILSDASISFKVSAVSACTVYVDNIMIGTADTADVVCVGDVNCDEVIDIRDLIRIHKVVNNSKDNYCYNNADILTNHTIDVYDVQGARNILLINPTN